MFNLKYICIDEEVYKQKNDQNESTNYNKAAAIDMLNSFNSTCQSLFDVKSLLLF